jgi:Holliday junction DNA helicase RuvA
LIAYLEGKLVEKNPTLLVLEVNGVGYSVNIPVSTYSNLGEVGQTVKVLTFQQVREDELKLFGFSTRPEKELFGLLISVNGVGPKVALSILSCIPVGEFQRSVLQEDLDALTSISGVGKKTAQRLIVELKEKLGKVDLGEREDVAGLHQSRCQEGTGEGGQRDEGGFAGGGIDKKGAEICQVKRPASQCPLL